MLRLNTATRALLAGTPCVGLCLAAAPALAQNYGSAPLGGRSGAMGGATVAEGHDSAAALMNPANLSLLHRDTLSLSANVYGFTGASSEDFYQITDAIRAQLGDPESARLSLDASTLDIYPSALGYYAHFGGDDLHMVAAFSFFDVARANYSFTGEPQLRFDDGAFRATSYALVQQDAYYFGPSYAIAVSPRLSFGVSAFTIYQPLVSSKASKALRTAANNTTFFASESEEFLEGSSTDLQFVAGGRFQAGGFSVGLSAASPSIHLSGDFDDQFRLETSEPGGVDAQPSRIRLERFTGDLAISQPVRVSLGLAYGAEKSWSVAADGHVYLGGDEAIVFDGTNRVDEIEQFGIAASGSEKQKRTRASATKINAALGGEVYLNDSSALRFGVFLDNSTNDPPGTPDFFDYGTIREDRMGLSAGYGLSMGPLQSDFGVMAYLGSGDIVSKTLFDEQFFKAKFESYGVLFYVAGSMDIEKTREKFADKIAPGAGDVAAAASDPSALADLGTVRPLALADVDPGLAAYTGRPEFDALAANPVELRNIQNPKYDAFFERGARLRGSVLTTRTLLDKARRDLEGDAAPAAGGGSAGAVAAADALAANPESLTPERKRTLGETRRALRLATGALKGLANEGAAIVSQGQGLLQAAPEDFKGPLAAKAPQVAQALSDLLSNLAAAVSEAPALVADAAVLGEAMAAIPDLPELELPGVPALPAIPDVPAIPAIPEVPEVPGTPAVPAVPAVPEAAAVPDAGAAAVTPVPVAVPAGGTAAPAEDAGRVCFVSGRAPVKFRIDASHKAKVTGSAPAGTEMRCFESKAGWRRIQLADGSVTGYLPENYIRFAD